LVNTPTDPNQAQAWISGEPPDQTIDFYIPRGNTGPMGPVGPVGPSVSVGDIIVTSGPPAPGTVGPQGIPGVKGDPGGFTAAVSLGTADLNSITTDGLYRQNTTSNATLAANYPVANTVGLLYVNQSSTASYMQQIFYPGSASTSRVHYIRVCSNGIWQPWRTFTSVRVDQTIGRTFYQWDEVNGREQLVYGDTGPRSIGDILLNGWVAAAPAEVSIRRVGNIVTLDGKVGSGTATADLLFSLPNGFRPRSQDQTVIDGVLSGSPSSWKYARVRWDGNIYLDKSSVGTLYIAGSWSTTDAWPTLLPGTALGTIPNV
jgi:hypothetical protein